MSLLVKQFDVKQESPNLVTVTLTGRIGPKQWAAGLAEVARLLPEGRLTSILVLADAFEAWGAGDWENFDFQRQYDQRIGRMAIVADQAWEDRALIFACQGMRKFPIEFFASRDIGQARHWLTACA